MRFFIALEIPEEIKPQFQSVQHKLSKLITQARITDPSKLHLTFAFLGEQEESIKGQLIRIINEVVKGISPFQVTPTYMDGFPNIHEPKVIWVGVSGDVDKIIILRERI